MDGMTIQVTASVVIAVAGALIFALTGGKASEIGRIAFGVGLLACVVYWR